MPYGIWGDQVVGVWAYGYGAGRGFTYEADTWSSIHPEGTDSSLLTGISGDTAVGFSNLEFGNIGVSSFLYDASGVTWIDCPFGPTAQAWGIYGDTIVGIYRETLGGDDRGFILTIPEPASLTLVLIGAVGLMGRRTRRSRAGAQGPMGSA